jgi:TatD DNase family protein
VPLVAAQLAQIKQIPVNDVAMLTSRNFDQLFKGVLS